jgi:serine/threonine protein kinase
VLAVGAEVHSGYKVVRVVRADRRGHCYEVEDAEGKRALGYVLWLRLRERALERWIHETTHVNRVLTPGIPKTLATGTGDSERAVVVTELVTGESLEELRRHWGGRLPGPVAMEFVCEILDLLETAHGKGVVHGALRSESVLVDPERKGQRLAIPDIAFARLVSESYRKVPGASNAGVLLTLAPEQRKGELLADARTDVYGVAALAMGLLGADLAALVETEGADARDTRRRFVEAAVAKDGLPNALVAVFEKALSVSRQERYAAAWVFARELRIGLGLIPAEEPDPSPADGDGRSIVTLDQLVRVMIDEARLSMGSDTPGDPLGRTAEAEAASYPGALAEARSAPVLVTEVKADRSERPRGITEIDGVHDEETSQVHYVGGDTGVVLKPSGVEAVRRAASITETAVTRPNALSPSGRAATSRPPSLLPSAPPVPPSLLPEAQGVPPSLLPEAPRGADPPNDLRWLKGTLVMQREPAADAQPPPSQAGPHRHDGQGDAGRYAIDRPIASGGMATVYLGKMFGGAGFSRTVAIKKLHAGLASDPKFSRMMLDEARMASRITHPNVVPILDVVTSGEGVMLVFEYVFGVSVGQLARTSAGRRALPLPIAAAIVVGALRGLEAAHTATDEVGQRLGLVHRDISPQNLMVGSDGAVRVIDFGIARALGRAEVTTGNELRGKASYMAPERFRGQKSDHRIDLWAMGVVFWELVCGAKLFDSEDPIETALMVCTGAIRQTGVDALDRVLERALNRDVDARFSSAAEMAKAIESALLVADSRVVAEYVREQCPAHLEAQREALRALDARFVGLEPESRKPLGGGGVAISTPAPVPVPAPLELIARAAKEANEARENEVELPNRQVIDLPELSPASSRGWWIHGSGPTSGGAARAQGPAVAPLVSTRSAWVALAISVVLFVMSAATCILRP